MGTPWASFGYSVQVASASIELLSEGCGVRLEQMLPPVWILIAHHLGIIMWVLQGTQATLVSYLLGGALLFYLMHFL